MKGNLIGHRGRHKDRESRWGKSGGGDGLPFQIRRAHSRLKPGEPLRGNTGILSLALLAFILGTIVGYLDFTAGIAGAEYRVTFPEITRELDEGQEPTADASREFPVPVQPLPKTITPCRACHGPEKDFPVDFRRREALNVHKNVKLHHGDVRVWCLDCHDPQNRNYLLALSDGKPIPFDQSYRLCGKCHGTKYRDWRYGIHGRRTGNWNGEKTYYLCVSCHDPHSPKFKPIQPMPPPAKPWTPKEKQTRH